MKTFENRAAQGDVFFKRITEEEFRASIGNAVEPEKGMYVIAHSETGHNHVMVAEKVRVYEPKEKAKDTQSRDLYALFLDVQAPTDLVHQRTYDTHETIRFSTGYFKAFRQRQYTPEGYKRVID